MSRFVDRGAITAAWVGVGMAVTIGVSFLLVIPIEFLVTPFALFAGLLIGYYANARSNRAGGPWGRILANALLAGVATGITFALFLLVVKVLFFAADNGYRDASAGGSITCQTGADCVYQRYLAVGRGPAFEAAGITDVASFTSLYWREQAASAGLLIVAERRRARVGGAADVRGREPAPTRGPAGADGRLTARARRRAGNRNAPVGDRGVGASSGPGLLGLLGLRRLRRGLGGGRLRGRRSSRRGLRGGLRGRGLGRGRLGGRLRGRLRGRLGGRLRRVPRSRPGPRPGPRRAPCRRGSTSTAPRGPCRRRSGRPWP